MTHSSALEYLHGQIEHARVKSTSHRYFLQPSRVREIFTPELLNSALAEIKLQHYERIELFEAVRDHGITTFAILVWMRKADYIVDFRNSNQMDAKLPIDEERARQIAADVGLAFAREHQWEFLPYIFRKDMSNNHHNLHDQSLIFPFIEETDLGEGGYGQITKLTLPQNMQEFFASIDDTNVSIVRKRIKKRGGQSMSTYDNAFRNEMTCLRLLSRLKHSNIIPLLGSYTFSKQHYLLFPCFDMDLRGLFLLPSRPQEFEGDHTFFLALAGLASALECTHNLRLTNETHGIDVETIGYHFDIQPSNVLVDQQRAKFILADFGLGKLKSSEKDSATHWKVGGGDYVAPECMNIDFDHQTVGRAIDIWALGCLLIELATYMTLGSEGVQEFRKLRLAELTPGWETTYFYDNNSLLKSSVSRWIENVSQDSNWSLKRLLQIALGCLDPNPLSRPRIEKIQNQLSALALRELYNVTVHNFSKFVQAAQMRKECRLTEMRFWFQGEQFKALGHAIPHAAEHDHPLTTNSKMYDTFCEILDQVLQMTCAELTRLEGRQPLTSIISNPDFDEHIEIRIRELWDLLPSSLSRIAQAIWIQSIRGQDIARLEDIESQCRTRQLPIYNDVGAAAHHMRAIRLRMSEDSSFGVANLLRPWNELNQIHSEDFHYYGTFCRRTRVLVEWTYYRPEWSHISEYQRLSTMELRAKIFNADPKPPGLRVLKCLGFVEAPLEKGERPGYGFMYQLPDTLGDENEYPTTLHQLLIKGTTNTRTNNNDNYYSQAPLLGRFRLAHALAIFFQELYTVDFLHENFCSNNVIFAYSAEVMFTSTKPWAEPYIIGFQRSRPDGQSWDTEGPSDDKSMLDYEHPDYRHTERFVVEYDYYSLGLVLLEIGLWCPLQMWSHKHKTLSPREFRSLLLRKYVPRLASSVGEVYRDAVQMCLDGTFERDRSLQAESAAAAAAAAATSLDTEVFESFIKRVVDPLEHLAQLRI